MSIFSDYFNEIKDRRELTVAQIAEMCGKDKSLIFYWSTGKHLPENWKQVEEAVHKLQLSFDERNNLQKAYEKTKLGEKKYNCFSEMREFLNELAERDKEKTFNSYKKTPVLEMDEMPEFLALDNKVEILYWLQRLLDSLMQEEEKELYLKFEDDFSEIWMLLKLFCGQTTNCEIKEFIYTESDDDKYNFCNVNMLRKVVEVFEQKHNVEIYTCNKRNYGEAFETNWIITERMMLLFDSKMSEGLFLTDKKWIAYYKDLLHEMMKQDCFFGKKRYSIQEFLYDNRVADNGNSIEHMPCIGPGVTKEILERRIHDHIPEREQVIQSLYEEALRVISGEIRWNSFFGAEGLIEFMETGRIESFSYDVYSPLDLKERCIILENMISLAKKKRFMYHMMKSEDMKSIKGSYLSEMEINGERCLIINYMIKGAAVEQIEIREEGLKEIFVEYCEYLKEYGRVYSEEETIIRMEEILERYKKKLKEEK